MRYKGAGPFEKNTARYESWFSRNQGAYLSELDAVRALLPVGRGVEIGVGTGRFAGPLGVALGIDCSREMVNVAKVRGIEVIQGAAEALPIRSSSLDTALMVTAICFFGSPKDALREAHRVLRPGGSLVVGFIDSTSPLGRHYSEHRHESVFYKDANFFSADELRAGLEDAGFRALEFVQTISKPMEGGDPKEPVRKGHGTGSFVVVKAVKPGEGCPEHDGS